MEYRFDTTHSFHGYLDSHSNPHLIPVNLYDPAIKVFEFPAINTLGVIGFVGVMAYAQVYRYRRASTPARRLQSRWVVFGKVEAWGAGACLAVVEAGRRSRGRRGHLSVRDQAETVEERA
jgi:hypothetical protein